MLSVWERQALKSVLGYDREMMYFLPFSSAKFYIRNSIYCIFYKENHPFFL